VPVSSGTFVFFPSLFFHQYAFPFWLVLAIASVDAAIVVREGVERHIEEG